MKLKIVTVLICLLSVGMINSQEKRKKIIYSATFVEKNLQIVGLSDKQWEIFYKLTYKLTDDVKRLRKETGVTQEIIKKRDEVYQDMKKDPAIKPEMYLTEMGKRLNLTKEQLRGFSEAKVITKQYNKDVLNILTSEQKLKFSKLKKTKLRARK